MHKGHRSYPKLKNIKIEVKTHFLHLFFLFHKTNDKADHRLELSCLKLMLKQVSVGCTGIEIFSSINVE